MPHRAKEGELYKRIELDGKVFHIYYGYYDEKERNSKYNDPLPIYPDFKASPEYTSAGFPFVTGIQDVCEHYKGRSPEDGCHSCKHYQNGDDLIGVCKCEHTKKKQ